MRVKKGDMVKITTGKDAGKSGKVIRVYPKTGKVTVEGLNIFKKHVRPRTQNEKGQTVDVPRPIDASNVALVCPSCHKAVRTGSRVSSSKKERYCKKCKATI